MQSERKGRSRFRDFERNAGQMRMLFQHFVQNFYTKEQNRFSVSAERAVKWEAQPEDAEAEQVLPQMRVDVVLSSPERWVLIDTKFTAHSMDRHPRSEPSHPKAWRVKKIQVVGSVRRGGADEPERSLAQHQQPVASRQNSNDTRISPSRTFLPARVCWYTSSMGKCSEI